MAGSGKKPVEDGEEEEEEETPDVLDEGNYQLVLPSGEYLCSPVSNVVNLAKQSYCIQFLCLCVCVCVSVCVFVCVHAEVMHGTL